MINSSDGCKLQLTEHFVCRSNFNAEGIGLRGAEVAGADVDIFAILAPLRVRE